MNAVAAAIFVLIGAVMFIFGPRIARIGLSLRYSYEELQARSGTVYWRVRLATIIAFVGTMGVGAAFVVFGVRALLT